MPRGTKRKESESEAAPIPSKKIRNRPLTKIAEFPKVYRSTTRYDVRVNVRVKIASNGIQDTYRCVWMIDDVEGCARTVMMTWLDMRKSQSFIDFFDLLKFTLHKKVLLNAGQSQTIWPGIE